MSCDRTHVARPYVLHSEGNRDRQALRQRLHPNPDFRGGSHTEVFANPQTVKLAPCQKLNLLIAYPDQVLSAADEQTSEKIKSADEQMKETWKVLKTEPREEGGREGGKN